MGQVVSSSGEEDKAELNKHTHNDNDNDNDSDNDNENDNENMAGEYINVQPSSNCNRCSSDDENAKQSLDQDPSLLSSPVDPSTTDNGDDDDDDDDARMIRQSESLLNVLGVEYQTPIQQQQQQPLTAAEESWALLTVADADQFHASWSNTTKDDILGFSSSFPSLSRTHQSAKHLVVERPAPVSSRVRSNQSARHKSAAALSSSSSSSSFPSSEPVFSSVIHDAARITNWTTVKSQCETNPEAARFVGRDRWTALHHACNRRCPYAGVVEALITAYPEALLVEEDKGWLPLHYACRFKAKKDVVRLLLHLYPEKGKMAVSRVDRRGRTPLYYAVRYDAPPGVVGLLLEVDASAVLEEDQDADSPLALVWDAWAEKLDGKRTLQRLYVPTSEAEGMTLEEQAEYVQKRLQGQVKLQERWNKVTMFLKAAFGFSVDEDDADNGFEEKKVSPGSPSSQDRKWRLLHATAAIKCHPSLFLLACALHPEQAFELDEKDLKAPAHVCAGCQSAAHLTVLHFAASSQANGEYGKLVLNRLLALNPESAQAADSEGCLPLHRIVENKDKMDWEADGVNDLYMANTSAVHAVDLDGRLPLHRAATCIVHDTNASDQTTLAKSVLCYLLEAHLDGASHADNFGCLPLHLIAQNGRIWDIQAQAVYVAYPSGARARTGVKLGNCLPLHLAAANPNAKFSLINHLVEVHPRGASQSNRQGKLPLHLACETGLSWPSIRSIHEAFPDAIRQPEQNQREWTALHMAAACPEADKEMLLNLLQLYPESAAVADSKGRYPLHLTCLSGKSWDDGASALFDAYPDALRCPDNVGLLPFHIAAFRYCAAPPNENIKRPDAIKAKNRRFSHSVSFEAEYENTKKDTEDANMIEIMFHLLKADPTVV